MTASLSVAPGYVFRHPRPDELAAAHELIVAVETADLGESTGFSLADLEGEWRINDPARDIWVAEAGDGALVAYVCCHNRRHVRLDAEGYVHPDHLGRGLGTALVRLSEDRAREHVALAPDGASVVAQNWINARNPAARALLEREGYAPVRFFWHMETALSAESPAPIWPSGIVLRPFAGEDGERAAHLVVGEAFADHWGYVPLGFEEWIERRRAGGIDPDLWFVAYDGDQPAGAALCSVSDDTGSVDTLAVRRPWRGAGLGKALLRHAFAAFRARGLAKAGLGVDAASPTGATRLYEGEGMRATQEFAVYGKELRAGADLADLERDDA